MGVTMGSNAQKVLRFWPCCSEMDERSDGDFIIRRRETLNRLAQRRGIVAPWHMPLAGCAGLAAASSAEPLPTMSGICTHTRSEPQPMCHSLGNETAAVQSQAAEDFQGSEACDDSTPPPTPLPHSSVSATQE